MKPAQANSILIMWQERLKVYILNFQKDKISVIFVLAASLAFSWMILKLSPILEKNILFLVSLPFVFVFFIFMIISPKHTLIVLFFIRALLDPALNTTKFGFAEANVGIGAGLNLIIIILWIIIMHKNPKIFLENRIIKPWILFLAICGISISYTPEKSTALKLWFNILSYLAIFSLPLYVISAYRDIKYWLKIVLVSFIITLLVTDFLFIHWMLTYSSTISRFKGTFTHPNILAFYTVLGISVMFYLLKTKIFHFTQFQRRLLILLILNLFLILIATKTRSAWLATIGLFIIYGLIKEKKYLLFTLILPLLLALNPIVWERIYDLFSNTTASILNQKLNSFAWRWELWKSSLPWIRERLIFGHGLTSFAPFSEKFFQFAGEKGVGAHNTYLEVIFDTGIIGLFSYLSIYFAMLRKIYTGISSTDSYKSKGYTLVFAYLISYLIVSYSDNMLYYLAFNWYFFFFLGIILKSSEFYNEKNFSDNPQL